jgi:hypothetical protein
MKRYNEFKYKFDKWCLFNDGCSKLFFLMLIITALFLSIKH